MMKRIITRGMLTIRLLLVGTSILGGQACARVPRTPKPQDTVTTVPVVALRLASSKPAGIDQTATTIVLNKVVSVRYFAVVKRWKSATDVSYFSDGATVAIHHDLQFAFSLTPTLLATYALRLVLRNSSESGVHIDWNAVNLIGPDKRGHGVMRQGVRFMDAGAPMAPSTVAPGSVLDDSLFPKDHLSLQSGGWRAVPFFEPLKPGDRVALYLPLRRGNEIVEYQFEFETAMLHSAPEPKGADMQCPSNTFWNGYGCTSR